MRLKGKLRLPCGQRHLHNDQRCPKSWQTPNQMVLFKYDWWSVCGYLNVKDAAFKPLFGGGDASAQKNMIFW